MAGAPTSLFDGFWHMRFKHIAKPTLSPPSSGRATGSSSAGSTGVVVAEAMAGASERDKRLESPSTLHYCNQNTRPALAGLAGGRPRAQRTRQGRPLARPCGRVGSFAGAKLLRRKPLARPCGRVGSFAGAKLLRRKPLATLRSRWKFRWRETSTAQAPMEQMRPRLIGHGTRRGDAGRRPCRARARFRNGTPQGRPLQPAPGHARRRLSSPVPSLRTIPKRDARATPCPMSNGTL